MEEVKGYVDHIIFRNPDNGYTVFQLNNDDGEVTCVGNIHFIEEGELFLVKGEYVTHSLYGVQLSVSEISVCEPEDLLSIEKYLGSGAIKGLGPALAGRIVKKFKEETFRIIEEEPERLSEVKGISERKAMEIAEQVESKKEMRNAMIYLQKFGVSTSLSAKLYQHYGNSIFRVIEENPYQMADEVAGVGFKTADEIAKRAGISMDSDFRIKSGIYYALTQAVQAGHIYLSQEILELRTSHLLGVDIPDIETFLMDLSMERKIIIKEEDKMRRIYISTYYYMELNTAKMLHDLNITCDINEEEVLSKLKSLERATRYVLDDGQRRAVVEAARNGVLILTGGPGTGKTTTINALIDFFETEGMNLMLAAPTGRAAKKMTEATGYEAKTIHRLLEVNGGPDDEMSSGFQKNAEDPLETDVIIIDEMSMVDLPLMHALLQAVCVGTRLILVGDRNQLPSVGPGSVLKDMIESECFPVVKLEKIFRQAEQSDIVVNAHKINRGEYIILDNKSMDFFFLKRQDANTIISVILTLIQKKLPKFVQAEPEEIQVLTPMKKGLLGVERLNQILQRYLNPESPKKEEKEYGDKKFRVGDKVMQIKNNYQIEWEIRSRQGMLIDKGAGIFNGDMGKVHSISNYEETLTVEYDDHRLVTYSFDMLDELELAYAITIHKAQGSEYPAVIIPLLQGPRQLYNRNLIYTAVTRARKCVTLVGSDQVFYDMVENNVEQNRNTTLAERSREFCL